MAETVIAQKALTPQLSAAFASGRADRIAGYVVPVSAVDGARDPRDVIDVHGLAYPGSPFDPSAAVDVVRFPVTPELFVEPARGGNDERSAAALGRWWVDHPPFTGNGFVATTTDTVVPLSWMPSHRPPYGAEMWRYEPTGQVVFMARYAGAHIGWVYREELEQHRRVRARSVSVFSGGVAVHRGVQYVADRLDGGSHTALIRQDPAAAAEGFTESSPGVWSTVVPTDEIEDHYELDCRVRWNGLELRLADQVRTPSGTGATIALSLQHDHRLNEGLRLTKLDADWYEATLPLDAVEQAEVRQTRVPGWPGAA